MFFSQSTIVLCFAATAVRVAAQCLPSSTAQFANLPTTALGPRAQLVFGNLSTPRGIAFDDADSLLVVERGVGVSAFVSRNDSTCKGFERSLVVNNSGLTHGIEIKGSELYVSTQLQVLLYQYNSQTRTVSDGVPKVIVVGLPSDGGVCNT